MTGPLIAARTRIGTERRGDGICTSLGCKGVDDDDHVSSSLPNTSLISLTGYKGALFPAGARAYFANVLRIPKGQDMHEGANGIRFISVRKVDPLISIAMLSEEKKVAAWNFLSPFSHRHFHIRKRISDLISLTLVYFTFPANIHCFLL